MKTEALYMISLVISVCAIVTLLKTEGIRPKNPLVGLMWLAASFTPVLNTLIAVGFVIRMMRMPFYAVMFAMEKFTQRAGGVA